jgi:hypothetical protein
MDRNNLYQAPVALERRCFRFYKCGISALFAGVTALVAFSWYVGGKLSASANQAIGAPPESLDAIAITFPSESGSTIQGWWSTAPGRAELDGAGNQLAVVHLHPFSPEQMAK